jgi:predicted ATPase with chaperone activity
VKLARRLTTTLPAITLAEAIETTRIHSVAGLTGGCCNAPQLLSGGEVSAVAGVVFSFKLSGRLVAQG